jgi:EAL domain-containing protein (putative c-di-GMP-specific phosphodiesterase class I)
MSPTRYNFARRMAERCRVVHKSAGNGNAEGHGAHSNAIDRGEFELVFQPEVSLTSLLESERLPATRIELELTENVLQTELRARGAASSPTA